MPKGRPDAFTFEQTQARLACYERWLRLVTEGAGRELYEGSTEEKARSLAAPTPLAHAKGHKVGLYTVNQIFDAYSICEMLAGLVKRGNHLYSRAEGEQGLRPETSLEFELKRLE